MFLAGGEERERWVEGEVVWLVSWFLGRFAL